MKEIIIKRRAEKSILRLIEFIESQNTEGAGARWYESFRHFLESSANFHFHYAEMQSSESMAIRALLTNANGL